MGAVDVVVQLAQAKAVRDARTAQAKSELATAELVSRVHAAAKQYTELFEGFARDLAAVRLEQDQSTQELRSKIQASEQGIARAIEQLQALCDRPDVAPEVAGEIQRLGVSLTALADRIQQLEARPLTQGDVLRAISDINNALAAMPPPPDLVAMRKSLRDSLATSLGRLLKRQLDEAKASLALSQPQHPIQAAVDGRNGWTPRLRLVNKGTRTLLEVYDWFGGDGDKPATGWLGGGGIVPDQRDATNLRGPQGASVAFSDGVSEARVLEILEEFTMPQDVEYTHAPFTVTATGPTTVYTPAAGKRVLLRGVQALNDPDVANAAEIRVLLGGEEIHRGYAIASSKRKTGPVGGAVAIQLSNASSVSGTLYLEEIDP